MSNMRFFGLSIFTFLDGPIGSRWGEKGTQGNEKKRKLEDTSRTVLLKFEQAYGYVFNNTE